MKKLNFKSFNTNALLLATISVATLASCSKDEIANNAMQNGNPQQEAPAAQGKATGEYIVVMKDRAEISGHRSLSVANQLDKVKNMAEQVFSANGIEGINLNEDNTFGGNGFTAKLNASQLAALKNDARIAYIEEDKLVQPALADGDIKSTTIGTVQQMSWGTKKVGTGSGVGKTAWIIDSGIDPYHKDLTVDKTRSKSFLSSTQGSDYKSYIDAYGHGTAVAGIIGAKNNTYGTVGVAAGATLVSLRVMDKNGSAYISKIVAALNHVAYYGKAGDVVNLSIGVPASSTLDAAVQKVAAKGIFVAIAAGNNSGDAALRSPARVNATNVFTVSAMNSTNIFTYPSNYGATTVDYAAPGVNVVTTAKGGGYVIFNGTSSAAPHMAGVLLLNAGKPRYSGYVSGDKDSKADPILLR